MTLRRGLAVLSTAAILAGCGSDEKQSAAVPKGCEKSVPSSERDLPGGFPEPEAGLTAGAVEQRGEQLRVNGFAAGSPGDVTRDLLAAPGVKRIDSEVDGADAEASFTSGDYRYAFKLVKVCDGGSTFTAVRVREPGATS
jgi:hypothetical protein